MSTADPKSAQAHARAMAGTRVEAMPIVPASGGLIWEETIAAGGYASKRLGRGARLTLTDLQGDANVSLLVFNAEMPTERLNVADTTKVQWKAYLGAGSLLLSDMGRVLASIVDDSAAVRGLVTQMLVDAGHSVACAPSGEEAAAMALSEPFDAVVSDLWMPGVSGLQMCRVLREDSFTRELPIVLFTVAGDAKTRFWAESSGADAVLEKRCVRDLPRTRNAKIMRRVIRAKHLGATELGDLSGLENPAAIEEIARAR